MEDFEKHNGEAALLTNFELLSFTNGSQGRGGEEEIQLHLG